MRSCLDNIDRNTATAADDAEAAAAGYVEAAAAGNVAVNVVKTTSHAGAHVSAAAPIVQVATVSAAHSATAHEPAAVPVVTSFAADGHVGAQFHSQDDIGQYNYGYSNPTGTKSELKTSDGVTRGSYSYIDAHGVLQTVNYISDAMGFRVAATNLPVHHVEGTAADTVAVESAEKLYSSADEVLTPQVNYSHLPYAQGYSYTAIL